MRDKLVEKHKAVDEHESNFTAGRVNVRERYLHRTGIRGRKSWLFFAVLYILTLIVIVNLVVSGKTCNVITSRTFQLHANSEVHHLTSSCILCCLNYTSHDQARIFIQQA